jgi:predicted RNase H-like HicB family nuclease
MKKYLVIIQKAESNYGAYSPDVLGCVATGKTIEETLENMREALEFHLEGLVEEGDPLPVSRGLNFYLQQPEPIAEASDLITYLSIQLPHLI